MIGYKSYKVELRPNNKQRMLLDKSVGCARFAYNWGLNQRNILYKNGIKSISAYEQQKELCKIKKTEFPWMYDITKCAPQEALVDLDASFKKFYTEKKIGFPKFKSKRNSRQSYRITTGSVYITNTTVKLPKIPGTIKLKEKEYIPIKNVKFISYTISTIANKWFISVKAIHETFNKVTIPKEIIGVDLGIKTLATISDGAIFNNPKSYRVFEIKLNRTQRERCRRVKGSKNRQKSINELKRIHYKISCIRKDSIHKMTSSLVKTKPRIVVIEDLSVKNMLRNHKLAKSLSDASFGEIRRQLEYKGKWYGSDIIVADRFFPSSKLCSSCGLIKEDLTLKDRIYRCECGLVLDRDLNAAINLKRYGEFHRSLSKQKACGEERLQSEAA
jgi:putative transposase